MEIVFAGKAELLVIFAVGWAAAASALGDFVGWPQAFRSAPRPSARLASLRDFLLFFFLSIGAVPLTDEAHRSRNCAQKVLPITVQRIRLGAGIRVAVQRNRWSHDASALSATELATRLDIPVNWLYVQIRQKRLLIDRQPAPICFRILRPFWTRFATSVTTPSPAWMRFGQWPR